MRPGISRAAIIAGMLLGSSTLGTFCVCSPEAVPPPDTTTECGEGAAPAQGEATLVLANPDTGLPLAAGEVLTVEYGDQGGQHVFVLVRQHAIEKELWTYTLEFHGKHYDDTQGVIGSNSVIVDLCAPGWTESHTPVFLEGPPGDVALRMRATNAAGTELTAEVNVTLE